MTAAPSPAIALGFVPLATSILVAVLTTRGSTATIAAAPAGWTWTVQSYFSGDDFLNVLIAPAAGLTEFPIVQWGGAHGTRLALYEVTDAVVADVTVGAPSTGGAGVTVLGPAVPVRVGGPALAIGIAYGYQGDPVAGCYWITPATWAGLDCGCSTAGGNHPWSGEFSKQYANAPASIGVTANDSVGQGTHGVVMAIAGASPASGVVPRHW